MTDEKKFEAFKRELVEENEKNYGKEAREKYGAAEVDAANRNMMGLSQEQYAVWTELGSTIQSKLEAAVRDELAPDGMHELVDQGQFPVFLLGNKGQLSASKVVQQHHRVCIADMVTHQQKTPILRQLIHAGHMDPDLQHRHQGRNIQPHHGAVESAVAGLGLGDIYCGAHDPKKEERHCRQHHRSAQKAQWQHPPHAGSRPQKDSDPHRQQQNACQKHTKLLQIPIFSLLYSVFPSETSPNIHKEFFTLGVEIVTLG